MTNRADTIAESKPWTLVVRTVIHDGEDQMLLLRRSTLCRNFVGCWEWPGGKLDPGEDFVGAAKREAREETSLDVEIIGVAGATHFETPVAHFIILCMEARALGGEPSLSKEHDQFAWVAPGEFEKLQFTGQVKDLMLEYAKRKRVET